MKILYLTNIPSPYRVDFFNELSKGIDLTVVFDSLNAKDRNDHWFNNSAIKFKYKAIHSGNIFKLNKILNKEFDLIIVGGYSTINGALSILLLKLKRINFIINADGGFIAKDNFLTKFLKTYFISSAKYWISTSSGTTEYLVNYGAKKENVYVYPFTTLNSSEIEKRPIAYENKIEMRKRIGYNYKTLFISVGRFIHLKGFDILLKAIKNSNLSETGFLIIGGGPLEEEYNKFLNENQIKNVHIIDFMNKQALLELYKSCDIFVFPTRGDVWGLVINEAMSCGLPVITTTKCLAGIELLDKENLYDAEDIETLTNILINLNSLSKDELLEIGERNCKKIANYTIESMSASHIEIFNEIINLENKE